MLPKYKVGDHLVRTIGDKIKILIVTSIETEDESNEPIYYQDLKGGYRNFMRESDVESVLEHDTKLYHEYCLYQILKEKFN